MANRNREAGNKYELWIMDKIKFLFPNILTSRNESRTLDAQKVDFCNTNPFQIQCKLTQQTPNVDILDEMPEGKNVIIWGKTRRKNKNIVKNGDYVIMKLETFIELITTEYDS